MRHHHNFLDPVNPFGSEEFNPKDFNFFIGSKRNLIDGGLIEQASAWKMSHMLDPYNQRFSGLSFGEFTLTSNAVCEISMPHLAPNEDCDCGFYAFDSLSKAIDVSSHSRGLLLMKVEFYGKIIEHDYGFRAEEQVIEKLFLNSKCSRFFCRRPTVGVIQSRRIWRNVCEEHTNPSFINIEKLSFILKREIGLFNKKSRELI